MSETEILENRMLLGLVVLDGTDVVVADPCYESHARYACTLRLEPGVYVAFMRNVKQDKAVYVADLGIMKIDAHVEERRHVTYVAVDSGQMSLMPKAKRHPADDTWYEDVCDVTLCPPYGGVIYGGCTSSAGYGDGMYPVDVLEDAQGRTVGAIVTFIDEDDSSTETVTKSAETPVDDDRQGLVETIDDTTRNALDDNLYGALTTLRECVERLPEPVEKPTCDTTTVTVAIEKLATARDDEELLDIVAREAIGDNLYKSILVEAIGLAPNHAITFDVTIETDQP
jgi:hypothetical protein